MTRLLVRAGTWTISFHGNKFPVSTCKSSWFCTTAGTVAPSCPKSKQNTSSWRSQGCTRVRHLRANLSSHRQLHGKDLNAVPRNGKAHLFTTKHPGHPAETWTAGRWVQSSPFPTSWLARLMQLHGPILIHNWQKSPLYFSAKEVFVLHYISLH